MRKSFLLAALLLNNSLCYADYNDGVAAYQRGDYQSAMKQWKAVAEQKTTLDHDFEWKLGRTQDSTEAQYGLALLYWQGKGTPQNYHEAEKWLLLAANSGHSDAQLKLAYLYYLIGVNGKKNPIEAQKWFEKSAQQGNVDAQYNLGVLYKDGVGIKKDLVAAKKWLTLAAQQGDAAAKKLLADLGSVPEPTEKSPAIVQQAANKSTEPQLIVGPYPSNIPPVAVQADEKPTPVIAQQAANKPTEPQLVVAPYPDTAVAVQAVEKPTPVIATPAPIKTTIPQLTESISPPTQAVEKNIVIPPSVPVITQATPPAQNAPVAQDEQYYAIQLLSSPKQHDTLAFVEHWQANLKPLLATDKLKKSERIFIIAYGRYVSPNEAKQAIASLPDELKKNHPWVIKMRGNTFVP